MCYVEEDDFAAVSFRYVHWRILRLAYGRASGFGQISSGDCCSVLLLRTMNGCHLKEQLNYLSIRYTIHELSSKVKNRVRFDTMNSITLTKAKSILGEARSL